MISWWKKLSNFWCGFITGGVVVPLCIIVVEIIFKLVLNAY